LTRQAGSGGRGNIGVNGWKTSKWKIGLIKYDIAGNVNATSWNMKTFVALVKRAIPKKNTFFGSKLKFAIVIWTEMRPTSTPKNLEKGIIGNLA
jgi:hypothetical protein